MAAERHDGDFLDVDYSQIELRVLALFTDHGVDRRHRMADKERCLNALMTPTGGRHHG
jgi:hypothetical protein